MKVTYASSAIRKICTIEKVMRKECGDIFDRLRLRLAALDRAESVGELQAVDPLGKWHQLTENLNGYWAGKVSGNYRILIEPLGEFERAEDAVAVEVIKVRHDYHGK